MTKLVVLSTPKAEIRADVVALLKETLEEAERGEINAVVIMSAGPDSWSNRASNSLRMDFRRAIGQLELLKAEWIQKFTSA